MVYVLKISLINGKAFDNVNKIAINFGKAAQEAGFDIAKRQQRNLRLQLTRNGTIWRKNQGLWGSIQARRQSKKISKVFMRRYGIYLDRMKPHYVALKRGRLIRQWALTKGNPTIKAIAEREGSIWVRPHPFISDATARTFRAIPEIIKNRTRRVMQSAV